MATDATEVTLRAAADYGIALDHERARVIARTTDGLMAAARAALLRVRFEDEPADFKTTLRFGAGRE
ncbi:MAG: hypothetical protein EXQ96_06050 [Alphaproteobacteria bacterium]|nr:hypothetical protein [Alphaproteobacteria bacterium]